MPCAFGSQSVKAAAPMIALMTLAVGCVPRTSPQGSTEQSSQVQQLQLKLEQMEKEMQELKQQISSLQQQS